MIVYGYNVWSGKEIEFLIGWIDSKSTTPLMGKGKCGEIYLCGMNTPYLATIYSFVKLSELEKKKLYKLAKWE